MIVVASSASTVDREHGLELLRRMLLIRRFEEKSAELYSLGKIRGFLHLYIGEEAVAVGAMQTLTEDDRIVATYRDHGHALADKLQGNPFVTACFFGDGAVAEGEFHETLNLAALWKLPVLFCCENNLYAMGTALERAQSETDLALKASAYRIPAWPVDGMDVHAVAQATRSAVEAIRAGEGPHFLEFRTYRFRAHSMFDPELYRSKAEVEEWRKRDPIPLLIQRLRGEGRLDDAGLAAIEDEVAAQVDAAVAFAESSEWEPVDTLLRHVTSEVAP